MVPQDLITWGEWRLSVHDLQTTRWIKELKYKRNLSKYLFLIFKLKNERKNFLNDPQYWSEHEA